ncbi:TubC N-terminal docking domain-related protein [Sansalvadorimonas verongulae]|uniref:TubC N-terminal docking domain-related protein n=1 Tax=Sansalvadorimonas verongulae TaxID=2172824 RepID=UPI0012BC5DE5|nr:hypothetical protein [Sansalvadorimonas verongulae]MTI11601.1 hypothetical protein [Sansalvadorimonas verongulae]
MTPLCLLYWLKLQSVQVDLEDDRLRVRGPKSLLTSPVMGQLKAGKEAICQLMSEPEVVPVDDALRRLAGMMSVSPTWLVSEWLVDDDLRDIRQGMYPDLEALSRLIKRAL